MDIPGMEKVDWHHKLRIDESSTHRSEVSHLHLASKAVENIGNGWRYVYIYMYVHHDILQASGGSNTHGRGHGFTNFFTWIIFVQLAWRINHNYLIIMNFCTIFHMNNYVWCVCGSTLLSVIKFPCEKWSITNMGVKKKCLSHDHYGFRRPPLWPFWVLVYPSLWPLNKATGRSLSAFNKQRAA